MKKMPQNTDVDKQKLLEFIEEVVSAEEKDGERILAYFRECDQLGLEVFPLDANKSAMLCTLEDEMALRMGFSVLIPGGAQFLEDILTERQKNGHFQTLQEFCERVNLDTLPENFLLHSIEAGAFDSTGASRSQLLQSYGKIVQSVQKSKADRSANQISLFDMLPAPSAKQLAPMPLPEAESLTDEQIIEHEKNASGFSFTEYQLQRDTESSSVEDDLNEPDEVSMTVVPLDTTEAIVKEAPENEVEPPETADVIVEKALETEKAPEDEVDSPPETADVIVEKAPETADISESPAPPPFLAEEPPLTPEKFMAEDRDASFSQEVTSAIHASKEPEQTQSSPDIEDALPPSLEKPAMSPDLISEEERIQVVQEVPSAFIIQLQTGNTTEDMLLQLQERIQQTPGEIGVIFEFVDEQQQKTSVKAHADFSVAVSEEFVKAIKTITGEKAVRLTVAPPYVADEKN